VVRIRWTLAAHAAEVIVHPEIDVECEIEDGVRGRREALRGSAGGKILEAAEGAGVRPLAVE
jgi:hypothetical protein